MLSDSTDWALAAPDMPGWEEAAEKLQNCVGYTGPELCQGQESS